MQGSFTFLRLLAHYGQGVNQKTYLTETLASNVKSIISRPKLDLGTDPLSVSLHFSLLTPTRRGAHSRAWQIYRSEIAKEETATGAPSRRPKDVDYKEAIVDKATQAEFIKRKLAPRLIARSDHELTFSYLQISWHFGK